MVCGSTVHHQPHDKSGLHANSVWNAKSAIGRIGHFGRMVNDSLDDDFDLATLSLGCIGPNSVFRVSIHRYGASIEYPHIHTKRVGFACQPSQSFLFLCGCSLFSPFHNFALPLVDCVARYGLGN